ncbi:hypothetical protein EKO04_007319 [Ascochyta lentis]|uniref:Uncharacterized protein n=1 Tax=Ascochyta lentis TaxID=205686 RepID=A0A8H7J3H3_9PLEO|nr:hypothetical protein EKO04_007319 [Ascochyta lentis]
MRSNFSLVAFTLYQIFLVDSVQGRDLDLAGREISWDPHSPIYTTELDTRALGDTIKYCVPDLGITRNTLQTKANGKAAGDFFVYSSVLTFANNDALDAFKDEHKVIQNPQLAGLARDGYNEMKEKAQGTNKKKHPAVMTAMFIDKTICMSSSIKGLGAEKSLIWNTADRSFKEGLPVGVQDCMQQCHNDFARREGAEDINIHRRRGGCGECLALVQYFTANPTKETCKGSIFVTVTEEKGKMIVFSPCGTRAAKENEEHPGQPPKESWGCQLVTKMCGGDTISDESTPFEDYAIGKKNVNGVEESDADYRRSVRFHTQSYIPIPTKLYVF